MGERGIQVARGDKNHFWRFEIDIGVWVCLEFGSRFCNENRRSGNKLPRMSGTKHMRRAYDPDKGR